MIHPARILPLNALPPDRAGQYVLYWIQASQRESCNHALEHAISLANDLKLPLLTCFGLTDDYPEANARHYAFMLQGLADLYTLLQSRGIKLVAQQGHPPEVALHYAKHASLVVTDRGYLRHQRAWRDHLADHAGKQVIQVESDIVVPVETASDKPEYAARTIRPKIHRHLQTFLTPLPRQKLLHPSLNLQVKSALDLTDPEKLLASLKVDRSVLPTPFFTGGPSAARRLLHTFISSKLPTYHTSRNEPAADATSHLSPYLNFGQISPLEIALAVLKSPPSEDRESYLEELIVRRELGINFCFYTPHYDTYAALPAWAQKTLAAHARDKRSHLYTPAELESAQTHDPYWNAAQLEMTTTGFMHNYMRMYWAKKILEWSPTPEQAHATTLHLNNKYLLDGRSPNAFSNTLWPLGLHDRPWGPERPTFGLIRYMNAAGLERKFDIDAYVKKIALLAPIPPKSKDHLF